MYITLKTTEFFSGTLLSADPLKVSLQGFDKTDMDLCIGMKLKWYEENRPSIASVSAESDDNGVITFSLLSSVQPDTDDSHSIEFRNYLDIVKPQVTAIGDLRHRTDQINTRHRSSLGTQIKKILTDETLTNQYMFKLLMQVDSKLDELLDNIKQDEPIDGLKQRKLLSIGGSGIVFIFDEEIAINDTVYVQALPKAGLGINFAALCKIKDIIKNTFGKHMRSGF